MLQKCHELKITFKTCTLHNLVHVALLHALLPLSLPPASLNSTHRASTLRKLPKQDYFEF